MAGLREATLDFAETAPWRFDCRGVISSPPDVVWAAFADAEGWTRWFKGCRVCRSTSEPPHGVGSTRRIELRAMRIDERFIGWEPGRLWAFTVVAMRPAIATELAERATFTALDDGRTAVTYRIALAPRWWLRPCKALVAWGSRRVLAASFAELERHLTKP